MPDCSPRNPIVPMLLSYSADSGMSLSVSSSNYELISFMDRAKNVRDRNELQLIVDNLRAGKVARCSGDLQVQYLLTTIF